MGLLAYILTLPGNNDACGHQPRGTYLFFLLPPSYLFLPLFIPSSFLYILFFLLLPHLIPFSMYVCIYLPSLSHPHHRFYMYVLLLSTPSICLRSLSHPPPHFSMSVCIFLFFTLFFIFGPIWGTFVIITNIWKNF